MNPQIKEISEFNATVKISQMPMPDTDKYAWLSRYLNLLLVMNITLFVSSGLVIKKGYWFCIVASSIIIIINGLVLNPWSNPRSHKLYQVVFWLTVFVTYLTIASIIYWIQHDAS
ncbi:MAG: hypothetical protein EXR74_04950 [Bdellovibrionales bacterium]|nr:hypothetical protein [Bdellovibrionales bacterium]